MIMGNDKFYNGKKSTERKPTLIKLKMITEDSYNEINIENSKIYKDIEKTIYSRNDLVHNKSKEDNDIQAIIVDEVYSDVVKSYESEENILKEVEDFIKTLYDFASYIDNHDKKSYSVNSIFFIKYYNTPERNYFDEKICRIIKAFRY